MDCCVLAFLFKKLSFFVDHHSTGEVHCHPYTISRSSQMGGIFILYPLKTMTTGRNFFVMLGLPNIHVAHTLIGGTLWPSYSVE